MGLPIRGNFGHPRAPMRWSIPSFAGATLRGRVGVCVIGFFSALANVHGQTVEIGRTQIQSPTEETAQFATIAIVDSKDILSLDGDVIIANTTLIAQNEPQSPSEFNPDPGAMQREQPENEQPPELFPPILPQTARVRRGSVAAFASTSAQGRARNRFRAGQN